MKRTVVWSHAARDDDFGIIRLIAQANPDAAERVADTIDRVVAGLGDMATGRPGRVTGTYEKVVPGLPSIVAYEVTDQPGHGRVAILHVIHGARLAGRRLVGVVLFPAPQRTSARVRVACRRCLRARQSCSLA